MTMKDPVGFWENNQTNRRELNKVNMNSCLLQYDTLSNLNTLIAKEGMLMYSTDTRILMYDDGTDKVPMQLVEVGDDADKPSGLASNDGRIFFAQDTGHLYTIIGGTSYQIGSTSGSLSDNTPEDIDYSLGSSGTNTSGARSDHTHRVSAEAPTGTQEVGGTDSAGSATSLVSSSHVHAYTRGTPVAVGDNNVNGDSGNFADANHVHAQQSNVRKITVGTEDVADSLTSGEIYAQREA